MNKKRFLRIGLLGLLVFSAALIACFVFWGQSAEAITPPITDAGGKISQLVPATQAMNAFRGLAMVQEADFSSWEQNGDHPCIQVQCMKIVNIV